MRNRFTGALRPEAAIGLASSFVLAGGCSSAAPPQTEPILPEPDVPEAAIEAIAEASFTAEQVDRGQYEFRVVCGECHTTSEFRGRNFQFEWRRRTAWSFYRTITQTMPENAPGSLMDEQYVDVIAYILDMNGFEAGDDELPATKAALDQFVLDGAPIDGGRRHGNR